MALSDSACNLREWQENLCRNKLAGKTCLRTSKCPAGRAIRGGSWWVRSRQITQCGRDTRAGHSLHLPALPRRTPEKPDAADRAILHLAAYNRKMTHQKDTFLRTLRAL